jgi:hypothetical protein
MIQFKNKTLDELLLSPMDEEVFDQLLARLDYERRTSLTNPGASINPQRFENGGRVGPIHPDCVSL